MTNRSYLYTVRDNNNLDQKYSNIEVLTMAQAQGDKAKLKLIFDKFDKNGNGVITHDELRSVLDEAGYALSEHDLQVRHTWLVGAKHFSRSRNGLQPKIYIIHVDHFGLFGHM